MRRGNRELWYSLVAIVLSTAVYGAMLAWYKEIPAASDFYGHLIGILGFLLMLATETLYSLRKRSRRARWGRMSAWLEFHIFTGLVGPYLVLLHSSGKFNGVAGVAMLLTGVIVVSGFIGRYIYTAVPSTESQDADEFHDLPASAPGPEHDAILESDIRRVDRALESLSDEHRIVLLLHDAEERTLEEISSITGAPIGTVKSRLHRARERLRQLCGHLMEHFSSRLRE